MLRRTLIRRFLTLSKKLVGLRRVTLAGNSMPTNETRLIRAVVALLAVIAGLLTAIFVAGAPWANHVSERLAKIETLLSKVVPDLEKMENKVHEHEVRIIHLEHRIPPE